MVNTRRRKMRMLNLVAVNLVAEMGAEAGGDRGANCDA